jgi:hypothetical protein
MADCAAAWSVADRPGHLAVTHSLDGYALTASSAVGLFHKRAHRAELAWWVAWIGDQLSRVVPRRQGLFPRANGIRARQAATTHPNRWDTADWPKQSDDIVASHLIHFPMNSVHRMKSEVLASTTICLSLPRRRFGAQVKSTRTMFIVRNPTTPCVVINCRHVVRL